MHSYIPATLFALLTLTAAQVTDVGIGNDVDDCGANGANIVIDGSTYSGTCTNTASITMPSNAGASAATANALQTQSGDVNGGIVDGTSTLGGTGAAATTATAAASAAAASSTGAAPKVTAFAGVAAGLVGAAALLV